MKIVITDWQTMSCKDEISYKCFENFGNVFAYPLTAPEETAMRIGDAEILLCNKTPITADVIKQCSNLRYIGVLATGYNNIDMAAAADAGITVCNAGTYSTDAVAQYVFAQILYHYNKIHLYDESVRNGDWIKAPAFSYFPFPAYELSGKTLAVIGYGSIGKKVAKIGDVFGMNVIISTRTKPENCPFKLVSIQEAFSKADVLTIHTPLTPKTKGLVSRENIALMKPSALLINSSRGPVVDEYALADALKKGMIAGAAVDVLEKEPMDSESPLKDIPNCTITPHIAWSPIETRQRLLDIAYCNLKAYLQGKPQNVVSIY